MTDAEYLNQIHSALGRALDRELHPEHRKHLQDLREITWQRVRRAQLNGQPPIVFAQHGGYWQIGEAGREWIYPDPGLAGLSDGWAIHLAGITARDTLHANTFGTSPNALRNRLKAAADWIERATGCWPLAAALRRPAIVISDDGTIDLDASTLPEIRLG